ncbi:MAG: BCCT family transporter, partial [Pseudomonadota bacterium]
GAVVAGLLMAGGHTAIQTAMVIGAFPFSIVMLLQCVAIVKAVYNDSRRANQGVAATTDEIATPAE